MSPKLFNRLVGLIAILALLFLLGDVVTQYRSVDSVTSLQADGTPLSSPNERGAWQTVVNFTSNANFVWRYEPVTRFLEASLFNVESFRAIGLPAFLIGVTLGFLVMPWRSNVTRLLPLTLFFVVVFSTFGFDTAVLGALTYFPLFTALVWRSALSTPRTSTAYMVMSGIVALLLVESAHQFSVLLIPLALVIVRSEGHAFSSRQRVVYLAAVLFALYRAFSMPSPEYPNIPQDGHVVPIDGLGWHVRAWIGPDRPYQVIERAMVKAPILLCAALVGLCSLILLAQKDGKRNRRLLIAAILAGAAVWDSIPYEQIAEVGPLYALSRVIPNLIFVPLSPLVLALSLYFAFIGARNAAHYLTLLIMTLGIAAPTMMPPRAELNAVLIAEDRKRAIEALVQHPERESLVTFVLSPSYRLINQIGLWILLEGEHQLEARSHYLPRTAFSEILPVDDGIMQFDAMLDHDPATRWSRKNGVQRGDEYLSFCLETPLLVSGVRLNPGNFWSDYPRGLKITTEFEKQREIVANIHDFQGGLGLTRDGFPYYHRQDDVRIFFPTTRLINCMMIEQIGRHQGLDWSIAELRLLIPKRRNGE